MRQILEPGERQAVDSITHRMHGVLVRVAGTGVLITGSSGIGKSECALELIEKGNQLVADDVVEIVTHPDSVIGKAPALTFELLEIRGLGIINVRQLFGEGAVKDEAGIDLCIELSRDAEVDRLNHAIGECHVADKVIPKFTLPVNSGRNLSTLVETAVRLFQLRDHGAGAADLLIQRHQDLLDSLS